MRRRIQQPPEPLFQIWLASVHAAAAALAASWAITNLIAVLYHLERIQEMRDLDAINNDLSFDEAVARRRRLNE